jgi:hypothetical protein
MDYKDREDTRVLGVLLNDLDFEEKIYTNK